MKITLSGKFLKAFMLMAAKKNDVRMLDSIGFSKNGYILATDGYLLVKISCPALKGISEGIMVKLPQNMKIINDMNYTFDLSDVYNVTIDDGINIYNIDYKNHQPCVKANHYIDNINLPLKKDEISNNAINVFAFNNELLGKIYKFSKIVSLPPTVFMGFNHENIYYICYSVNDNEKYININNDTNKFTEEHLKNSLIIVMPMKLNEFLRPSNEQLGVNNTL